MWDLRCEEGVCGTSSGRGRCEGRGARGGGLRGPSDVRILRV